MVPEKYSKPPQAPIVFNATAASVLADSERLCDDTRELLDGLVKTATVDTATFESVLRPIAEDENVRSTTASVLCLYQKVSTDPALRAASAKVDETLSHFLIDSGAREDVFRLVDAAYQKHEDLDGESRKLLEEERRNYIRNGLALASQADRDRLKAIRKRLSTLASEYSKNLDDADSGAWFAPEELDGVPPDVLEGLERGTGDREGKLKVTFKDPEYGPVMRHALSANSRREAWTQRENVSQINRPLFVEVIRLRNEAARILGYSSHAAYKLEIKMAKDPESVFAFLHDLRDRASRHRAKEMDELLEIRQKALGDRPQPSEGRLEKWDVLFYGHLAKVDKYAIDSAKIAEYFPLEPTVAAMLRLFGKLFGFVFVELSGEAERARLSPTGKASDLTWHEDVIMYSVWNEDDEGGDFVGYLYLDLHPRPGKYGHAQCYGLQLGFAPRGGQRRYPSTTLLTNFTKPTRDSPALLRHGEVVMLFHELGHGMHDLAGRSTYARFHGAETVGDFNEAPSQMLENWCWDPLGLRLLSSHYQTGEALSDELIDALIQSKHAGPALGVLQQLRISLFDMTVHSAGVETEGDLARIYNELYDNLFMGREGSDADGLTHGYVNYRHLIEGADAGYYGYYWSNVHAMDMFDSVFKKDPLNGKEGRRYRHMVLEKGGTQDEMLTLTRFLGRMPKSDAFFKDLGLD